MWWFGGMFVVLFCVQDSAEDQQQGQKGPDEAPTKTVSG